MQPFLLIIAQKSILNQKIVFCH